MEVILREDVDKLGHRGEVVKVAEGYGRNFLLPRGLAMAVNEANKAMIAQGAQGLGGASSPRRRRSSSPWRRASAACASSPRARWARTTRSTAR